MPLTNPKFVPKSRVPVLLGTTLVAAYIAFTQRHYILQDIAAEAEIIYKQDPEMIRVMEEAKEELNR